MMIRVYPEIYLRKAMTNIGDMFDFAISEFGLDREDFTAMFTGSDICRRFENGEPKYLVGMSGIELALDVIEEMTRITPATDNVERYGRSPDHWCGWAAAYYQWYRGISFAEVFRVASYNEILSLYSTLHEADVSKFADVMDERYRTMHQETNLKRIRSAYGCSQSELAALSGVSLRSIQMYEQRKKDINKSQSATLLSLARTLGCRMEDLLEYAWYI